ncbi:MAG: Trm112 family protein [bacterium]
MRYGDCSSKVNSIDSLCVKIARAGVYFQTYGISTERDGIEGKAMRYRLLNFLVCPVCKGELDVKPFRRKELICDANNCYLECSIKGKYNCEDCAKFDIEEGILLCGCGKISDGRFYTGYGCQ